MTKSDGKRSPTIVVRLALPPETPRWPPAMPPQSPMDPPMPKPKPMKTGVPADSLIAAHVAGSDFHDAWSLEVADARSSALELFIRSASAAPPWIERCMALRNRAAALAGLKDLGSLGAIDLGREAATYRRGERICSFTLLHNADDEALLGDADKHLEVVLSTHRQRLDASRVVVTVTTVVKVRNLLGHLYMIPVRPMHRLIAPAVLASLAA